MNRAGNLRRSYLVYFMSIVQLNLRADEIALSL